ncbi:hypothetical protein K469DRAFT_28102 [Zopfia rhizophila CBS 207.26]|uniref:Uncharacterized protein n=1 Tax=Zopfia rhizophila CBS 207.26 TaxID=1314779 RepID=A0A6A6DFS0_9PEZI|nr:hypothetical protein K469DRAFT_28102 [Zopfia rhizophila CBS 207.26]
MKSSRYTCAKMLLCRLRAFSRTPSQISAFASRQTHEEAALAFIRNTQFISHDSSNNMEKIMEFLCQFPGESGLKAVRALGFADICWYAPSSRRSLTAAHTWPSWIAAQCPGLRSLCVVFRSSDCFGWRIVGANMPSKILRLRKCVTYISHVPSNMDHFDT